MREIKFKCWDREAKQWFSFEETLSILMLQNRVREGTADDKGFLERYVIAQFTGLKDKNGKEIYEGDIIRDIAGGGDGEDVVGRVYWDTERLGFNWRDTNNDDWGLTENMELEVIGNIYENPDNDIDDLLYY